MISPPIRWVLSHHFQPTPKLVPFLEVQTANGHLQGKHQLQGKSKKKLQHFKFQKPCQNGRKKGDISYKPICFNGIRIWNINYWTDHEHQRGRVSTTKLACKLDYLQWGDALRLHVVYSAFIFRHPIPSMPANRFQILKLPHFDWKVIFVFLIKPNQLRTIHLGISNKIQKQSLLMYEIRHRDWRKWALRLYPRKFSEEKIRWVEKRTAKR